MTEKQKRQLTTILAERQAVRPAEVSLSMRINVSLILQLLENLVLAGEVERLRPIGCKNRDNDHYRLIRETDDDFLWQWDLHREQKEKKRG